jgi:O-antigen/teichoic acid export membrane protein
VLTLVLATKLGVTGVGAYSLVLALYGVMATAGEAGAELFLTRELSVDRSRTASYVVHVSTLALGVCLVLTAVAELVIRHVGYSHQVESSVAIVLLAIFPKTLNSIQEAVFIVYRRSEFETLTTLVSSGAYLVISVLLLTNGHGVESIVAVYVGLEYLDTLVYFILIQRSITRLRLEFHWALARQLIREIRPFTASSALGALFARPEIIILSLLSTTKEVGYYSAAVRVSEIWLFVPTVFLGNIYPVLSHAHSVGRERFARIQDRALKYCLAYSLPVTVGIVVLSSPIIHTLFGHRFGRSVVELQLLAVNITMYTMMELFWRSVSARGLQGAVLRIQLVVMGTRLAIGIPFIAALSSLGAAIATPVNATLQAGLLERQVRRTGIPVHVFRIGWRIGLAAAVMGGAVWLLNRWLGLWPLIPIGAVIYLAGLIVLRAFPREDVDMLRRLLPARAA